MDQDNFSEALVDKNQRIKVIPLRLEMATLFLAGKARELGGREMFKDACLAALELADQLIEMHNQTCGD